MRRNSAEIVAMRKLASSKILNVEFYFTGGPREKENIHKNISLKESAKALGYLSEQEFDNIVKPELMVSPKKA